MRKRKQVKGLTALVAAAAMVVTMLPGTALTAKAVGETGTFVFNGKVEEGVLIESGNLTNSDRIQYKLIERDDGRRHLEITGTGMMPDYTSSGWGVTDSWSNVSVRSADKITTVAFGKGITRIGDYALYNSYIGNAEIWLPEGLLEIGTGALYFSSGKYVRIPSTVTKIESGILARTGDTYITLPASLTSLGWNYFQDDTKWYYPGTEEEFREKVKVGNPSTFEQMCNRIKKSDGFGKADPNYDQYIEYVPFSVNANQLQDNSFVDVKKGNYFYDAVNWAKSEGITSGEDATHFGTGHPLNRAAAVTFLYAYDGGGNTSVNSGFSDVKSNDWFAKQVTWAVQKGVTKGVGGNRFDPYGTVTRAQAVQFLYNYTGGSVGARTAFNDVSSANWFYNAVSWAVENNITSGTGNGQFSPNAPCLREQFVMFLYKLSQTK